MLRAPLLPVVGAAALIAVSQSTSYFSAIAPASPYVLAAVSLAGFVLMRERVLELASRLRTDPWPVLIMVLAYLVALAPVLLSGRPSFSSYMALADSAVHMAGADFLLRHGQDYSHLDLRNSYGQFINNYYNTGYPSGGDTLFGASAFLLRLPLIWAFQPFNAFMLATAAGPAWLLSRRVGLGRITALLATFAIILPALVYGYELIGSVKEIVALAMILALGWLVVVHRCWLYREPASVLPFMLVLSAGISALGIAFGAWALVAVAVLAVVLACEYGRGRVTLWRTAAQAAFAAGTMVIAAWPTWTHISGSLEVAQNIAATNNPGNLHAPLRATQVLGVWLHGSYKLAPTGAELTVTHILVAGSVLVAILGAVHLMRTRAYALAGWVALSLAAWFAISQSVTTWAEAKALVLTSPIVMLTAWSGVAALRRSRLLALRASAVLMALALLGGVLASDAMQYHSSDLAPTARYEELSSLNSRFAGEGPTLFTDFDEYALYELRDLDVAGPDFAYPPPALASLADGYGEPVELDRASPAALQGYPLIITRRDPTTSRPPSAYKLVWRGDYYEVWRRRRGTPSASARIALGGRRAQCGQLETLVGRASARTARLVAASAVTIIKVPITKAARPSGWGYAHKGLVMGAPGILSSVFDVSRTGAWDVWVKGQIMPVVTLKLDGQTLASISGQLSGNSRVPNIAPPLGVHLAAGVHRLTVSRGGFTMAPGDGGLAVLDAVYVTPAKVDRQPALGVVPVSRWRALCGKRYSWIELIER
ncbi:MAG TPA: hypothetical protein VIC05_06585 [Solirubrobacteraceae bacterium]